MSLSFNVKGKIYQVDDSFEDNQGYKYNIVERLDGGGNSVVFKVVVEHSMAYFAMKLLKYNDKDSIEAFRKETDILKEFSKKEFKNNFLTLITNGNLKVQEVKRNGRKSFQTIKELELPFYIMDLADKNIQNFLCSKEFSNEQEAYPYILQLSESLMLIHQKNYVHRDIKPQNILMQEDVPKIADFGLMVEENCCKRKIGPKYWPTPEFIELCDKDNHCAQKTTDIFQLGCIFFFLLTKKYPIGNISIDEIDNSFKLKPIISKMISYNKLNRYSDAVEVYKEIREIS